MILHPLHSEFLRSKHIQGGYDVGTVLGELRELPPEEGFWILTRLAIFFHDPSLEGSGGESTAESDFREMLKSIESTCRKVLGLGMESHFLAHAIVGFVLASLIFDCDEEAAENDVSRYEALAAAVGREGVEGAVTREVASTASRIWQKVAENRMARLELARGRYKLFCDRVLPAMLGRSS